jgi:hypothetical protein
VRSAGNLILITRNGETKAYTGWREWLLLAAAFVVLWLVLALMVSIVIGAAVTFGLVMLLVVPALALVALIRSLMGRA